MESITFIEIINATNGRCNENPLDLSFTNISTDSRKTEKGDLYIALEGEVFDGHDFVNDAVNKGAALAIVSKAVSINNYIPIIYVDNTLKALWDIAAFYRIKMGKPVIGVTGSVGKTSTKDMIAAILSAKYNIHKSMGNFNNEYGLPLTVLGLEKKHDALIVEMGMRGFGEISELTRIAKPDIAVITNIGISHIERLGSKENILKAKLEIVEGLSENGLLVLNANDVLLKSIDKSIAKRIIYIGIDTEADYIASCVTDYGEEGVSFKVNIKGMDYDIHVPAVGKHNVYNVLFGIACAIELDLSPEEIINGINSYRPEKMRLNIIKKDGIKFINDCYNSSPDSMNAALEVLKSLAKGKRAYAIIGNMFELGSAAKRAHYDIGFMCAKLNIDFSAIIGENAVDVAAGIGDCKKYKVFESHEDIVNYMKTILKKDDVVLIKGSRGMKMEKILELW